MQRRSSLLALAVSASLVIAACGGDDSSDSSTTDAPTTAAPTTEPPATEPPATEPPATEPPATEPPATDAPTTTEAVDPAEVALAYAERGPYPVGVTTYTRSGDQKVEVWYPAVEGTTGTETYDVRDFTPPAIRDILTADVPVTFSYEASRDAAAAEGTFPVVMFSHGFTGMRLQSAFLTPHLASYGMIVVSTDHPTRDMFNQLGGTAANATQDAVTDLFESLDLVIAENETAGSIVEGRVDADRVSSMGHSAGGGTVFQAASDDRIDSYVSLASGAFAAEGEEPVMPDKPSFFMAGALDAVVTPEERTRPAFEAAPSPSRLWILDKVGHNGFDDFCTFGNGTGIIGVAQASGLGPLLESQPQLVRLGEDGCKEPNVPVEEVFPIIRHATTAQLLYWFGVDAEPVGIGPEVAEAYDVAVEIQVK
jgi:dienelactone hydrolase